MGILIWLLIGAAAGWLAGQITKGKSFGLLGNIGVGIVGSMLGGFIFRLLGFHSASLVASLITATVGAVLLLYLVSRFKS
ncbi:GlsB/YeaQ/YmgE family stress response membrane protein [Agarivorans sp. QJM3NY_25]